MNSIPVSNLVDYGIETLGFILHAGKGGLERNLVKASTMVYEWGREPFVDAVSEQAILIVSSEDPIKGDIRASCEFKKITALAESKQLSMIVCSQIGTIPSPFLEIAEADSIPLISSDQDPWYLKSRIISYLKEKINRMTELHGVLVEVFGVGVYIRGVSGIGKSECALELIARGHKLIADDIVEFQGGRNGELRGRSPSSIKDLLEIRGLGIINVKDLFGVAAVGDKTLVRAAVELLEWNEETEMERLGSTENSCRIVDVTVPLVRVPVRSGGNMATIIEVIARSEISKHDK